MCVPRFLVVSLLVSVAGLFCSCVHTSPDTWTGRRWYVISKEGVICRFWGYVKHPGESWRKAQLVIMDERYGVSPPDRAPVAPGPPFYGDDHNWEYRIEGRLTGARAYDPNSDLDLPLFAAKSFHLTSRRPGALPGVGSPGDNGFVPGREASNQLWHHIQ